MVRTKSLGLLNRDIHDKVMEIKPGKLIADRFNLKEAETEFNEFDNEAKFFLSISSDYFHHKCMIIHNMVPVIYQEKHVD